MGLWSWAKKVVTEHGELDPVPIDLERTPDGYQYRLGVKAGFSGQETARIPIHVRPNLSPHPILKEIHWCEVAGQTLEAANPFALKEKVRRALEMIAPAHALPLAYFRVPDMDYELPAYEEDGQIVAPILMGPTLKARDMAGIRREVCRYLMQAGYVHEPDEVIVGVVRPRDLRRVPPAAVLRSLADRDVWMPTVEGTSSEGPVVGLLAHPAELRGRGRIRAQIGPAPSDQAPAAPDVVGLLRFVRAELSRRSPSFDPDALYAAGVRPEIWRAAEDRLEATGVRLAAFLVDDEASRIELPVLRMGSGDLVAAIDAAGINVLLAPDENALALSVGRYLALSGFLRFAEEVEIHRAAPPRAERLEPETIWTQEATTWS
ncbi:MAG TPA: hypothetical protein VH300_05735 [Thermoleophilaceae bacterium]|nr:hypothetical protein [Thermoleophilaceae bacterium]